MSSISISSQCHSTQIPPQIPSSALPSRSRSSSVVSPSPTHSFRRSHGLLLSSSGAALLVEKNWTFNSCFRRPCASGCAPSRPCRRHCCAEKSGGFRGGVCRAAGSRWRRILDDGEGGYDASSAHGLQRRRHFVGVISTGVALLGFANAGAAFDAASAAGDEEQSPSSTAAPAKIGLIEKLLERSKANKAKYDQQRLDDYYRRNYKDYFDFLKELGLDYFKDSKPKFHTRGQIINKDKDKLTEAEQGILKWLETNK